MMNHICHIFLAVPLIVGLQSLHQGVPPWFSLDPFRLRMTFATLPAGMLPDRECLQSNMKAGHIQFSLLTGPKAHFSHS